MSSELVLWIYIIFGLNDDIYERVFDYRELIGICIMDDDIYNVYRMVQECLLI